MSYAMTYIRNLKKLRRNLFIKQEQTHRHRKQIYGSDRRKRNKLGVWNEQIHSPAVWKIDKRPGPTIKRRELYSIPCNNLSGEEPEVEYIYIYDNYVAVHLNLPHCKSTILQ